MYIYILYNSLISKKTSPLFLYFKLILIYNSLLYISTAFLYYLQQTLKMQIEDYLIFDECLEAKIDTLAYQYYNDDDFEYLLYLPFEEMRDTMADDIFEELKEELIFNGDYDTAYDDRLYETVRCNTHFYLTEQCGFSSMEEDDEDYYYDEEEYY